MPTLHETLALAAQHHQAGQLQAAEEIYRQILSIDPNQADAWHLLGVIAAQVGQHESAETCIRRAVAINGGESAFFGNLGNSLQAQGKLDEAIDCFRRALTLKPDDAGAYYNLGIVLKKQDKYDAAIDCFRQALQLAPEFADAHNNLGSVLRTQKKLTEAAGCFIRAIELRPDSAEANNNLGAALQELDRVGDAIGYFHRALALKPDYAEAWSNLGNALRRRGQFDEAAACCRRAIELKPDHAEAHSNLGSVLVEQGQFDLAVACFRRALQANADFAEAYSNLGIARQGQGDLDEAARCFRKAIELKTDLVSAHVNLGHTLLAQGDVDESIACCRRALAIEPTCAEAYSNLLYCLHFCPEQNPASIYEEHSRWNERLAVPLMPSVSRHSNDRTPARRLRIGYISPNFSDHVVGLNLLPLFRAHNRQRFEIVCYSDVRVPDAITSRFRSYANIWRNIVGCSDDEVSRLIRADAIDVLVDLTLHMAKNRLLAFARQPAPVQVTFAGYPGTTGLATMDYRLTDPLLDPLGLDDDFYSEESIRLPDTFWCYDPITDDPAVNLLPALETGVVTFGCLNSFIKVNEEVLKVWARVLKAVDRSQIVVMAPEGGHRQRTMELLQSEGIAPSRVTFVSNCPRDEYLALYHRIDIGLDTVPYNGHTTSLDSLWMGVPIVTLVGQSVVGRAGLSHLSTLGLPELIARTSDQFVEISAGLAGDLPRLINLRASLRERMRQSPLMDASRFARNVETTYIAMWQRWCA
jgi:predicted O-linked N-acetylglucosamine transferase (SPINDLY family)